MDGRDPATNTDAGAHGVDNSVRRLGRRAFIAGTAGVIAGATVLSGTANAVEPGASFFVPMSPTRLCDTRERTGYKTVGTRTIRVRVAGRPGVPANAVAAVLTVTAVNRTQGPIFVSTYPAATIRPEASSLNCGRFDERIANLVTVKLGADGAIDIYSHGPAEIIVDLAGVYIPTAVPVGAGRFVSIGTARRVLDTRKSGKIRPGGEVTVDLTKYVTPTAIAVVANLTAVEPNAQGFVTAYPANETRPGTSNLNPASGQNRAVGVMTKLGTVQTASGAVRGIKVFTQQGAHILVDVIGYITGPGDPATADGLFIPMAPRRLMDTRPVHQRLWPGWTKPIAIPSPASSRAQAVVLNLTATKTMGMGFYALVPTNTPRPEVSTLNANWAGQTLANHAIASVTPKGVSVYSHAGGHAVVDMNGWFTGTPMRTTTGPAVNPPPPGGPIPWVVQVPRLGLNQWVLDGDAKRVVDAGNSWHWTGTGLVGEGAHVVLFGHRTEHGGPYRYLHTLQNGDLLYITTSDSRRYTYRKVAEYLTSKYSSDILAASRRVAGETVSLVACSRTDRLPTSLQYRLVSTFQLVGWEDLD